MTTWKNRGKSESPRFVGSEKLFPTLTVFNEWNNNSQASCLFVCIFFLYSTKGTKKVWTSYCHVIHTMTFLQIKISSKRVDFIRLCVVLDGMYAVNMCPGWQMLANKLGKEPASIENISRGTEKSPTMVLLKYFFEYDTESSNLKDYEILRRLQVLSNALLAINNHDAKDIVEEEIKERRENTQQATTPNITESDTNDSNKDSSIDIENEHVSSVKSRLQRGLSQILSYFPCRCLFPSDTEESEQYALLDRGQKDQKICAKGQKTRADSGYSTGLDTSIQIAPDIVQTTKIWV